MAADLHATVYVDRGGAFRIVPNDVTAVGVGVARSSDVDKVVQPSDEDLGRRVLAALASAGRPVPHPAQSEWSSLARSFHRAMGYRSGKALRTANVAVFVSREGDAVEVAAARDGGPGLGFSYPASAANVVAATPTEVGHAVRAAAMHVSLRDPD
jgi:hypothetical protein